jgi:hypothetical protein
MLATVGVLVATLGVATPDRAEAQYAVPASDGFDPLRPS